MNAVRKEIIPALVALILIGVVRYGLQRLGLATWIAELISAAILLVLLILLLRFYRPIRRKFVLWGAEAELAQEGLDQGAQTLRNTLARLIEAPNGSELSEATGLKDWYPNFDACRPRLEFLLTKATSVRLLTYMGVSDIGKGTAFYEAITRNREGVSVRVLLCSEHSPYVLPEFASQTGHNEKQAVEWKRRILRTQSDIRHIQDYHHHIDIDMKSHNLPFVWRLWFVDDKLFITAMLYYKGRENLKVPVYEIHRSTDQEQPRLFEMFERYFDREWDRASDV